MGAGRKKVSPEWKRQVGKRMHDAALAAGFATQEEMAKTILFSQTAICRWWSGRSLPDKERMDTYAALTNTTTEWLYNGTESSAQLREVLIQFIKSLDGGMPPSRAYKVVTGDTLPVQDRRDFDAAADLMRDGFREAALAPWNQLSEEEQQETAAHLLEKMQRQAEE